MTENLSPSELDPDVTRERMLDDRIDADAIGRQVLTDALAAPVTVTLTREARRQARLDPHSADYCAACAHDMHNCRGCDERIIHGQSICNGCREDVWPIGRD